MKKILLTVICALVVLSVFGQKKTIGVYLKDIGKEAQYSFTSEIIPQLNKNPSIEFVWVNKDNYADAKPFDFLMNVTADQLLDKIDIYDYEEEKTEQVKGKDGKTKDVKKKVRHSGVSVSFSTIFYVRLMNVATQEFLFGYGERFRNLKKIEDKAVRGIKMLRKPAKKAALKRKIIKKHETALNGFRKQFFDEYHRRATASIVNSAIAVVFEPPVVKEIVKERKGRAKTVRLEGGLVGANASFYIENSNGSLTLLCPLFVNQKEYPTTHLASVVLTGRKKLYKAFQEGKKIVAASPRMIRSLSKKCSVLDKDLRVASIIPGNQRTISFAKNKIDINMALSKIPNVKVFERQDILDLSKLFASENVLDDVDAFKNRDKLVGVDYLFRTSGEYYDVLNVQSGEVDRKQLDVIKTDGSVKGDLRMARKAMKSIFKRNASIEMKASAALSLALDYPTQIIKADKEKKGKAKHVQIQSLTILDLYTKYKVFRVNEEKVGDKVLKREVEIGEVKTDKNISGTCVVGAKVKEGGRKIMEALNNGDTLIIKFSK